MEIIKNYNLSKLNTFGINVNASFFAEINSEADLMELLNSPLFKQNEKIFLGGGSNVLFTKDFPGIVVLNKIKGIKIIEENNETVTVRALGGEKWNDLVTFSVEHGYWGIENLSLVPGTVGAAPMQNIGAYGAELKDTLLNVEAFDIGTGIKKIFTNEECELGYRSSIFKNKLKGKYFIFAVTLRLSKIPKPNISYKILSEYLEKAADTKAMAGKNKIASYSLKEISEAVIAIRTSKLPDTKVLGNAGSFFKNVFVPARNASHGDAGGEKDKIDELLKKYPDMPHFEEDGLIKIPSGWLIEHCGPINGNSWKGYRTGNVGVHDKQALVLVNHGNATGPEVLELVNKIISSVQDKFELELTPEVNLI